MKESQNKLKSLLVFFPAYNEQDSITCTIEKTFQITPNLADNFEIIIDDGFRDNTKECLAPLAGKFDNLKIITHESNKGSGAALKSGFSNSKYEYIYYTEAFVDLFKLWKELKQ